MTDAIKDALEHGKDRIAEMQRNLEALRGKRYAMLVMQTSDYLSKSFTLEFLHRKVLGPLAPVGEILTSEMAISTLYAAVMCLHPEAEELTETHQQHPTSLAFLADIKMVSTAMHEQQHAVGQAIKSGGLGS